METIKQQKIDFNLNFQDIINPLLIILLSAIIFCVATEMFYIDFIARVSGLCGLSFGTSSLACKLILSALKYKL
jgi:hypothetical protein